MLHSIISSKPYFPSIVGNSLSPLPLAVTATQPFLHQWRFLIHHNLHSFPLRLLHQPTLSNFVPRGITTHSHEVDRSLCFSCMRIAEMMKRRLNFNGRRAATMTSSSAPEAEAVEWEVRPSGMLVQKRSESSGDFATPNLRVRVLYGAVLYQISANSQSTFGELKKLLTAETGLQAAEQRLIFRGKERENGDYLDTCGVKDRSKVILIDDPESKERRMVEMRRKAKIETIQRLIDDVSTEVDGLAEQVSVIEKSIANGKKVAELQITTLIEMLMRQAVKLDNITGAEADACAQKESQGNRVQKCVEKLDVLKVLNAKQKVPPSVVTTTWETFEPSHAAIQWELFD